MSKITRRLFLMAGNAAAVVAQSRFAQACRGLELLGPVQLFLLDDQGSTLVDDEGSKLTTLLSFRTGQIAEVEQLNRANAEALIDNRRS